mmetsp:Transcript_39898/g.118317  ORF Transcript_39898/g.118317 Transcript_39898/m.118317 type:complete len:130 (+) Transcript_39898:71-460(+)
MSSSWVPLSTIVPSAQVRMTSLFSMVLRRWAMVNDVRFFSTLLRASCTTFSDAESRAEVASSRSMIWGSRTRARQIATRCFWPPDRRSPLGPTLVSQASCSFRNSRCAIWPQSSSFSSVTAARLSPVRP